MDEEPVSLDRFLDRLRGRRELVVPVLGSGVFVDAGAASSTDVERHLRDASGADLPPDADLYEVADQLEEVRGRDWVQDEVAAVVKAQTISGSPALRAIARAPSGIFVTTNYDLGLEVAAVEVGLDPRTFLLDQANEALSRPPSGRINVIHVHGVADEPRSIVLSRSTYQAALDDERMQLTLRLLASQHELLFLGFAFGEREAHVERDLLWSAAAFQRTGPHWLVLPAGAAAEERQQVLREADVEVVTFIDPAGSYEPVRWVAQVVGASAVVGAPDELPRLDSGLLQPYYLQPALARGDDVATRQDREQWEFLSRMAGGSEELDIEAVEQMARVVLLGEGGFGKTQMLYCLGTRTPEAWPVLLSLGTANAPREQEGLVDVFVSWMANAQAVGGDVPRVTRSTLEDGAYLFLLDGLDQVPGEDRRAIVATIGELSRRYPQHRYVVSSRRIPDVAELGQLGFDVVALVPRSDWLYRYAEQRGLTPEDTDQLTAAVPAISDLLKIPLYGAAAVEMISGGGTLPETALGLTEIVADRGLQLEVERLRANPDQVRQWLDRLAVAMELLGISEINREHLLHADLQSGLDIAAAEPLLDELITRALLAEGGGVVRFPANVVQEARAARFLLEAADGFQILEEHVIMSVSEERGIRPSWVHTIDLVLTAAPKEWRDRISVVDRAAAVRAIPADAPLDVRTDALQWMWTWYQEAAIWLPRDRRGELLDDRDAISRLALNGVDGSFRDLVRDATASDSEIDRGNAIYVLGAIRDVDGAMASIPNLVTDENSVVRRHAAVVAVDLHLSDVVPVLRTQLADEDDELAEETLTWAVVTLLPNESVGDFVLSNATSRRPWRLWSAVAERWTRLQQLEFLAEDDHFSERWFSHLLQDADDWSEDEVRVAAGLYFAQGERLRANMDVRTGLGQHPHIALDQALRFATSARDVREVWFLTSELSEEELTMIAAKTDEEAVAEALLEVVQWRKTPPEPITHLRARPPTLKELLDRDATDEIIALRLESEVQTLSDADVEKLSTIVRDVWAEADTEVGSLSDAINKGGPQVVSRRVLHMLEYAQVLRLRLDYERWLLVARLDVFFRDFTSWLRDSVRQEWMPRLADDVAGLPTQVVARLTLTLGAPWPRELASAIVERLFSPEAKGSSDADVEAGRDYAVRALTDSKLEDLLRELASACESDAIKMALVEVGDCDVEQELLSRLAGGEDLLPRYIAARKDHWLTFVRCSSSTDLLTRLIQQEFSQRSEESYITLLYDALGRTAGPSAIAIYDNLRFDRSVPSSGFYWYPRDRLFREILETAALETLPRSFAEVAAYVIDRMGNPSPDARQ